MSDTLGTSGQLPGVSAAPQPQQAGQQPQVASQPAGVTEVARTILMDPELSPHVMCDRFWRLKQQHLRETYGINIE